MKRMQSVFVGLIAAACVSGSPKELKEDVQHAQIPAVTPTTIPTTREEVQEAPHDTADDCSEELQEPAVPKGSTVLLIGDSLAVGMSAEFRKIAVKAGYKPVTHAKIGSMTTQWLKWIKSDLKAHQPKVVVVSLGTNDAAGYANVVKNPKMHAQLVQLIEESGAFAVWIGPPAISKKRVEKIEEVRKIIKEVVPIYFASEELEIRLEDGIHANATGYGLWIRSVWHMTSSMMITHDFE